MKAAVKAWVGSHKSKSTCLCSETRKEASSPWKGVFCYILLQPWIGCLLEQPSRGYPEEVRGGFLGELRRRGECTAVWRFRENLGARLKWFALKACPSEGCEDEDRRMVWIFTSLRITSSLKCRCLLCQYLEMIFEGEKCPQCVLCVCVCVFCVIVRLWEFNIIRHQNYAIAVLV